MKPRIETSTERKLVGKHLTMSLVNNRTGELWQSFMPRRKEVSNLTSDMISMSVYKPGHFLNFNPANEFDKWAAVEVAEFGNIPEGFESFTIQPGVYAVFDYKGSSSDPGIFQYIFGTWLPSSVYRLDDRPHFEVLGAKYRNNDPASEEEIWIPVRSKV